MNGPGWAAWRRLWWAWVPAAVLAGANLAGTVYLAGTTHGSEAELRERVVQLEADVAELRRIERRVAEERARLEALQERLGTLEEEVLGTLEQRVVRVMRAVGEATRAAGLRPERFAYDARPEGRLGLVRFGVGFNVDGTFPQIRRLLEQLQASEELLIVDRLQLAGETEPRASTLAITVHVSTYVTGARPETLERLLGGSGRGRGTG